MHRGRQRQKPNRSHNPASYSAFLRRVSHHLLPYKRPLSPTNHIKAPPNHCESILLSVSSIKFRFWSSRLDLKDGLGSGEQDDDGFRGLGLDDGANRTFILESRWVAVPPDVIVTARTNRTRNRGTTVVSLIQKSVRLFFFLTLFAWET